MHQKILLFTSDRAVIKSLAEGLEKRGFAVSATASKRKMKAWASGGRADFLVIDATSAEEKGLTFCHELRHSDPDVRIIVALPGRRSMSTDTIDATFVAPITCRKVLYRINSLLQAKPRRLLCVGAISLDPKTRVVRCHDRETRLTPKAARLLQLLMQHAGEMVCRKDIMREVWDTDFTGDMRTIDVHVSWIRKAIEPCPGAGRYIQTVRGKGYLFHAEPHPIESISER